LHSEGDENRFRSIDEQLRFAINNERLVQLQYHRRLRIAEPHDYGVQKGRRMLLVYQREAAGPEQKGTTGWRLLDLRKIEGCLVLEETFPGSRGAAHPRHREWDVIYARALLEA
jgi:hypothetical protein